MSLQARPYRDEEDFWRIRAFLRDTFRRNGRHERNWQTARLDYWRWHCIANCGHAPLEQTMIWETPGGEIAAVVNPEGRGHAYFQVDPGWRSAALEEQMITVAEERIGFTPPPAAPPAGGAEPSKLTTPTGVSRLRLRIWCHDDDEPRREILQRRGYTRMAYADQQRRRSLTSPLPPPTAIPGYTIRALGGPEELPSRSWASWRAFHPNEPDDRYEGWEWYRNLQNAPLYRRDLDLVAVAEDGQVAAFTTVWYDDVTRTGYFEPVGRRPEDERRGLMRELMLEGMRRVRERGADLATIAGGPVGANVLYASITSIECLRYAPWTREWEAEPFPAA